MRKNYFKFWDGKFVCSYLGQGKKTNEKWSSANVNHMRKYPYDPKRPGTSMKSHSFLSSHSSLLWSHFLIFSFTAGFFPSLSFLPLAFLIFFGFATLSPLRPDRRRRRKIGFFLKKLQIVKQNKKNNWKKDKHKTRNGLQFWSI